MKLQESIKGVTTNIKGKNNEFIFPDSAKISTTEIKITGSNNKIILKEGVTLRNLLIHIRGSNHTITIGEDARVIGHVLIKGKGQTIDIGDRTTFQNVYLLAQEGKNIKIGADCMFSYDITVRTTDAHSVINAETGERVNIANHIDIGDHVWVAAAAMITKGVSIADDCIIGARSFVNKSFTDSQCAIAGTPAKVIQTGVTWSRDRL